LQGLWEYILGFEEGRAFSIVRIFAYALLFYYKQMINFSIKENDFSIKLRLLFVSYNAFALIEKITQMLSQMP
jgi:hypothetical protein